MKYLRGQSGFTLVELIITATFVAATCAAIVGSFITIGRLNKQARSLAAATQVAQQKIETYRNTSYASIPTGAPEDFTATLPALLGSPKTAAATVTEIETDLKKIDVAIEYTEHNQSKKVYLTTYITKRGLDR